MGYLVKDFYYPEKTSLFSRKRVVCFFGSLFFGTRGLGSSGTRVYCWVTW